MRWEERTLKMADAGAPTFSPDNPWSENSANWWYHEGYWDASCEKSAYHVIPFEFGSDDGDLKELSETYTMGWEDGKGDAE